LRTSGANAPHGSRYAVIFSRWIREHKFEAMAKSLRSVCIDLAENSDAITAWRDALPELTRRPLSVTRRWKATVQAQEQAVTDTRKAVAAWSRFVTHAKALTPEQALPLWQAAQAQASEALCR
jgi:hypothetical protein